MSLKHMEIFEWLINNTYIGVAVHKMIFDSEGFPKDYEFIDVNPTFERITGLKREEVMGKTIKQIDPDIEQEWINNYGETFKDRKEHYFEMYSQKIQKYFKVHAYSYEKNKFVTLLIDATDDYLLKEYLKEKLVRNDQEKNAQEEIKKLAEMLELGIKNGGIDVWDYDATLDLITFRSYNSEIDLKGEKHDKFSLAEHISYIQKEDLPGFFKELNRVQHHGQTNFNVQYRVFSKRKNKEIWMKSTGKVTEYDEQGNVKRLVGISQDITSSVENEQKITTSQKRLKQAHKLAHLGSWEYYVDKDKLLLSEEALQILECSDGINEFSLNDLEDVFGYDQIDRFRQYKDNIKDNHCEQYDDEFFIHLDSSIKKIHVIATRNYDIKGKLINIIGTLQDITERTALEERLRQAEKMTAVGQLAGGIAHDFNNILMSVSGYTELIMHKTNEPNLLKYCDKILESVRTSAELTKKLLAFSRKDSLFKVNLSLHECLNKAIEILAITLDPSINFNLDLAAHKDIIYADETEIQNVFINLCLNSRDAMPNGGTINITTSNVEFPKDKAIEEFALEQGEYISIIVSDTGMGIDKNIIKNIFEPFFTTKEVGKGTGLGLSAIYGTIVSHDGAITVESIVNQGTDFHIFLPVLNKDSLD